MVSTDWAKLREQAESEGGGQRELIPKGEYTVEVINSTYATSAVRDNGKGGKEQIKLQFKVIGGVYDDFKGVFDTLTLSPESTKAVQIFLRQMEALGAQTLMDAGKSLEEIAPTLVGARVVITTDIGEWQGQDKIEVKNIKSADLNTSLPDSVSGLETTGQVAPPF